MAVRGKVSSDVPALSVLSAVSINDSIALPTVLRPLVAIIAVPYAVRGDTYVDSVPCMVTP